MFFFHPSVVMQCEHITLINKDFSVCASHARNFHQIPSDFCCLVVFFSLLNTLNKKVYLTLLPFEFPSTVGKGF